jgi:dephospho-CoA kinase
MLRALKFLFSHIENPMLRIAVTGGIACGKSYLAEYLVKQAVAVCDADDLVHSILAEDRLVRSAVLGEFGREVIDVDGKINRRKLGGIVFADSSKLRELNAIVHPVVKQKVKDWLAGRERAGDKLAVVIIPLLFEAGMDRGWDAVVAVVTTPVLQLRRLKKRGLTEVQCRQRIDAQLAMEIKAERSDFVIMNDGSKAAFERNIEEVLREIQEKRA